MSPRVSVVIPFEPATAAAAAALADGLEPSAQVLLVGTGQPPLSARGSVQVIEGVVGKGRAIREALPLVNSAVTVLQDPDPVYSTGAYDDLIAPIEQGEADAVFGTRPSGALALRDRALSRFTSLVTDTTLADPLSGQRAFRTEALRSLRLTGSDDDIDSEIVFKLAAHLYRLAEVPVPVPRPPHRTLLAPLRQARTLLRYATVQNDADNGHDGYNTLARMEGAAPNYNRWIGRRICEYCGPRVLEVGAGIGTITAEIEQGRDLVVALEADTFYIDRLKNRFRGKPHVRPYLSDVALADWQSLHNEALDSIVLSNVLEHIPDDAGAVRRFGQILAPGGRVILLVPALPALFGSMDEAVGHHRRYTPASLRAVLEENGFFVEKLEWMNLVGIPGWFFNGRVLRRRAVPPLQLRLYDRVAPLLARAESLVHLPVGMSLFAVGRLVGGDSR